MANSVRLIDYTQPQGDFITFFTELDSEFQVGERVFIVGGNYDNTKYTDRDHPEFDPFNEFASGYKVIAVDTTTNSNAVTLNIRYRLAEFNIIGVETSVFNPLPVYKTEEELLVEPNQVRESYISKSYFKRGEFNGGTFQDGIFGEYNIRGEESTSGEALRPSRPYERQHFVNNLISEYRDAGRDAEADALENYDYELLEQPTLNNKAIFNNNFENIQAVWKNGVFIGGDYQWGKWESRYGNDKTGLIQTLNELGGPQDLLDDSRFNISEFDNNNNGFGYSITTSGNFGRTYRSEDKHFINVIGDDNTIQIDYFPYPLWKSLEDDRFECSIRVFSKDNDKVFDIDYISSTSGTNDIIIKDKQIYETLGTTSSTSFEVEQILFDEQGYFDVEIYIKDNESKNRNIVETGRIFNADIFSGVVDKVYMQGGDVHWGEFKRGRVASNYGRTHWNNGVYNGLKEESFSEDVRWNNGIWIDGNWKGDINVPIKNFEIFDNLLLINIPARFKHLLQIGGDVFISYFKKSIGNSYFPNFTDQPETYPVNFRTFLLRNIVETEELDNELQVQLVLEGQVDAINEDVNLQFARISQSFFKKGLWNDGIWESGLRKVRNNRVENFDFFQDQGTNFLTFQLDIEDSQNIRKGELMDVSNLQSIREIDIGIIDGVPTIDNIFNDDRNTQFVEPFNSTLTVIDVSTSGQVLTTFKDLNDIESDPSITWNLGGDLIDITEILGSTSGVSIINRNTELTSTIWYDGQFKSGAWDGGIWQNGILSSELYFDNNNTEIQSVWQSGYWKDGTWNLGALLSGIWEQGVYNDGVVTNLFDNQEDNSTILWDNGDTVFIDGVINNVEWRRGLMLSSQFNGGKIINGGIENVDFRGGQYTNGLGVYNNTNNANRSGRLLDDGTYTDLSAPNLIYIDGSGWVQLDQNSFYQKDYNVVIQDLDKYENPFNNELFNVLDRNKYGSRLRIDYSTSGDNPLYLLDEFSSMKPILAIDNIDGIAQISPTKYWIGDSNHKRILEIDTVTNEVDVLGLVIGDSSKDIYSFNQIKHIESASLIETSGANEQQILYTYIVDADENGNDIVKAISLDKQTIFSIPIGIDTVNEETITDISIAPLNNSLQAETVFTVTSQNKIFYAFNNWTEFKSFDIPTDIPTVTQICVLRKPTSNSVDLLLYSTDNIISHLILDFNITTQEYQIRVTSPVSITNIDSAIGSNNVTSFDATYNQNTISIWLVLETTDIIRFNYEEPFNGVDNSFISLNDVELDFPLSKISLSYDSTLLNTVGLNGNDSLFLATADLDKVVTGFGNTTSLVKFLDRNILSLEDTTYWYYDDATARLIHVNEELSDKYDVTSDVDTVGLPDDVEIIKMTGGDSSNRVFSIQRDKNTNVYSVRKSEYGKADLTNQTIFNINGAGTIYDVVYNSKLFLLSSDASEDNKPVITAIDNQVTTNHFLNTMKYYDTTTIYGTSGNTLSFDVVKENDNFLALVSSDNGEVFEIVLDNDTTVLSSRRIFQNLPNIYDVTLKLEGEFKNGGEKHYSAYLSTDNGVYKIFTDRRLGTLQFRWAEATSNLYFDGLGVDELNKTDDNTSIIAKVGDAFSTFKGTYETEDFVLNANLLSPTDVAYGISNQRVVSLSASSGATLVNINGDTLGQYDQTSRLGENSTLALPTDLLLNNPNSLIYAQSFSLAQDYIFFIDNSIDSTASYIRYYKVLDGEYNLISAPDEYKDLSYDNVNNEIYYIKISGSDTIVGTIDSTFTATDSFTVSGRQYEKFSYSDLGGTEVFACLRSDGTIDIVNTSGTPSTVSTNSDYVDLSLLEQLGEFVIFVQEGEILTTFTHQSLSVEDGANWSGPEVVNITDILNINEIKTGGSEGLTIYKNDFTLDTINVDPSNINEDGVRLRDFSFNSFVDNTSYIFLYNDPLVETSGIIKLLKTSSPSIGVNRSSQIDDISVGTFITLTNVDDDNVFALFNESGENHLYHYDFFNDTINEITDSPLSYRDFSESTPNLELFDFNIVDIKAFGTELAVLFEIIDDTATTSGHYDIASYNFITDNYSKVDFVYAKENPTDTGFDAFDINGDIDLVRYKDTSNIGGIRHIFKSELSPRLDISQNNDYMYFYFGDVGSGDFVKTLDSVSASAEVNTEFEDLKVLLTISGFNNNALIETIDSVTIYPDPNTGTDSTSAVSTSAGIASNQIYADFTNYGIFDTGQTYTFTVKTTLNVGQITGTYGNTIQDFRIYGSGEDKLIVRETISDNAINSIGSISEYYQLTLPNVSTGTWEIQDDTATTELELKAPIQPTQTATQTLFSGTLDNNQDDVIPQQLTELDNNYQLDIINKGYKVDYDSDTLSPYLTGRVLLDTLIQPNVSFNNLGTTKTAHLVASTWDSGLFIGTWDAPFYFDNKIIEDFSIFVNGIFEGEFYDGFFLGGTFRNSSSLESTLHQGHFTSDDSAIEFQSGNLNSRYRYDILNAKYENESIKFRAEGLILNGDDYSNTIISNVNVGSIVKLPEIFKSRDYEIKEIIRGDIKVNGEDEITLVIDEPSLPFLTTEAETIAFFKQSLFIQSFENADKLFGYFDPVNIFIYNGDMYITIQSGFNNFNNDGKYIPSIKPLIRFNAYNRITKSETTLEDGKYYTDFEVELITPDTLTDLNELKFVQQFYIKDNAQVMLDGRFKSSIIIPDYIQMFTTSMNKSVNQLTATFNSSIQNMYISNVIGDGVSDFSNITVDLGSVDSSLFAHDLMIFNSYITTPSSRPNDWLRNNIFLSGATDREWRSGVWLNLDETGFSKGISRFGDENTINLFDGQNSKVVDIFFEGENYLWIELEDIIFDVDTYRYITLRGFTGNKSQLIGATRSNAFRILEVDNNLIKIKNPFLEYQGILAQDFYNNFNKDFLLTQKQEMLLKGLYGINVRACDSEVLDFNNSDFDEPLSTDSLSAGWYQAGNNDINSWFLNNSKVNASGGAVGTQYNVLKQNYNFIEGVEYTVTINYEFITSSGGGSLTFYLDPELFDETTVASFGTFDLISGSGVLSFSFTPTQNYTVFGFDTNLGLAAIGIDTMNISSEIIDSTYEFDYAYASISCFNGGDFYGNFNTVWNAGDFRNGTFLEDGKWFGSDENYAYNGEVQVVTEKLSNKFLVTVGMDMDFVQEGDYIRLDYTPIFANQELNTLFEGVYGVVESATSGGTLVTETTRGLVYESNDLIADGTYAVNIIKHRADYENNNYLIVDYNSNLYSNSSVEDQLTIFDNSLGTAGVSNKVGSFDGSSGIPTLDIVNTALTDGNNSTQFTVDLWFNYENSSTNQPLFALHDSTNNLNGFKVYVLSNSLYMDYLNEDNSNITRQLHTGLVANTWTHLTFVYDTGQVKSSIDGGAINTEEAFIKSTHDVNYIGKMFDVTVSNDINIYAFKGKMDEFRVWNVNMFDYQGEDFFNSVPTIRDKKIINSYLPEITLYYNFDDLIDTKNYFPEEEDFFILNGGNGYTLKENDETFTYNGENIFIEIDYFSDKNDLSTGEYKLLTLEEVRDVSDLNEPNIVKYYLEVVLVEDPINNFRYTIELREKTTISNNLFTDLLNSTNVTKFDTDINFFERTSLILTDNKVYINGNNIGDYTLLNRNLFKYTTDTRIHLGKYDYTNPLEETFGFTGFITNVNLWSSAVTKDEYLIYRIISGETTETFNSGTALENNKNLVDGSPSTLIIPSFNNDGSQIWEHYIYSSENNYEQSLQEGGIDIEELDSEFRYTGNYLNTALPDSTWLDGTDFIKVDTGITTINDLYVGINNNNYILTRPNGFDNRIRIDGMENFKFFNKNVAVEGTAFLNIGASGYLFFEDIFQGFDQFYPVFKYVDIEGNEYYNQTSTTDAIQFNTILDIRETALNGFTNNDGETVNNIEYANRDDEFVIKFFGYSTNMNETGGKFHYENHTGTAPYYEFTPNEKIFSYFAIRFDKVNSNILIYTRRLDESNEQKYQGLRRSDGFWSHVNDRNTNRLSYYKTPFSEDTLSGDGINRPNYEGDEDYIIGMESTSGDVLGFNNTEYSLYIPRFDVEDIDDSFIQYIVEEDYDGLRSIYGIEIFKQFNGNSEIDFGIVEDNTLVLTNHYVNTLSDMLTIDPFNPQDFSNPVYDKNGQYLRTHTEDIVPRVSYFHNGTFNGAVWHNGIFVDGEANATNLIWKYGIKHNGTFSGNDDLIQYAHWLGGFHTTDTNNLSFMRNLVWYRGQFNGGSWEKGHWLALDLDNQYEVNGVRNDDWSLFNSGEWYSRIDEAEDVIITNLFEDADNGTFEEGTVNQWGLTINGTSAYVLTKQPLGGSIPSHDGVSENAVLIETTASNISPGGTFSNPIEVFRSNNILVKRNTVYEITAKAYIGDMSFSTISTKLGVIANNEIETIYDIGYRMLFNTGVGHTNFMDIQEGNSPVYSLEEDGELWVDIKYKFNTLENDLINIGTFIYGANRAAFSQYALYIDDIQMIGEKLDRSSADPFRIENHDSVWHGGIWTSPNVVQSFDEEGVPTFYEYTYQNDEFDLFRVKNNQVLDLPKVNSIWLGGLWLRGEFNGGIFANGFWHSVKCDSSTSGLVYEERIGSTYDETYSLFKQGQMINSIWEGGIVDDEGDKLDTIFGDLTQSSETLVNKNNSFDFEWLNDFEFKVSTSNVYSPELFGRNEFIGYHNDPSFDGSDETNETIEVNRVRRQFNTDGVMSVYWKRGKFNNGLLQFSHFDSINLNQNRQNIISGEEADNESIFKGLIYSSKWKNGLYKALATDDEYPLLNEEPNSLFYYSNWEKGYWKSQGLETTSGSPLDTTDNIQVSNALFSRSIWTAGVFEGGIFDLSIWRSGVEEPTTMKYKTATAILETGDPNNLGYFVSDKPVDGTNFEFGTSGSNTLPQMENDLSFIGNFENSNFRFAGSVDNLASIWVNGCMRGSIWHGGIWQRGMFRERTFTNTNELDFFGNIHTDDYQLGMWFRGIWMSGYFSYYNDKVIDEGANLDLNAHLYNNPFKSDLTDNNEGRRCLLFSINAESLNDPSNILGMNDDNFNTYISDASDLTDKNNYASIYSRTLLKDTITNLTLKSYFNMFNGSFINGTIYAPSNTTDFFIDINKMIFSLNSSLANSFLDTSSTLGSFEDVSDNNDGIFIKSIKTSSSTVETTVPYLNDLPTVMWEDNTNEWVNAVNFNFINNNVVLKQGNPNFSELNVWRHNTDESTSGSNLFGDGTLTTELPFLLDSDDNLVQVSVAQGCGMKWHSDEPEGEPKFGENIGTEEIDFNLEIIDFDDGDFDGTNFMTD